MCANRLLQPAVLLVLVVEEIACDSGATQGGQYTDTQDSLFQTILFMVLV